MKMNRKAIKAQIEEKAIQLYVMDNLSGSDVGNELGISSTEVFRILERHNIKRRQRKAVIAQKIIDLFQAGLSSSQISKELGLQERTIEIILTQHKKGFDYLTQYIV